MKTKIRNILNQYQPAKRDSLIPILQDIQDEFGYISKTAVTSIGKFLDLPTSKIFGVATFYNQFRFEAVGKYHIQICRGTACHVKGSAKILETLQRELGIKSGETTRDGLFSLEEVACIGACGLAPVLAINGEFHAKMTSEKVKDLIKEYREGSKNEEN